MKINKIIITIFLVSAISGCFAFNDNKPALFFKNSKNTNIAKNIKIHNPEILSIKTTESAKNLDLEKPLRCSVNWQTQELISAIPYQLSTFKLRRNGINDILPKYEVTGFSFKSMPTEKAIKKLVKEAGIKVIAKDAPYANINAENLRGTLEDVLNMLTEASEIYYSYDSHNKIIRLNRKSNFSLYSPKDIPIILSLLDVLRGSGITNITTDWEDYTITFNADYELEQKVRKLIGYFKENPILVTFDISMFKIYPKNPKKEVEWRELLNEFSYGTIKTTSTGVIGRIMTTSDTLNIETLTRFMKKQADVYKVSEGKFVSPNEWFSRFDLGKCSWSRNEMEKDISVLAKATLENNNRLTSTITLDTTKGEISNYNIRSRFGENILIIGLPNEIFGNKANKSETVIFMVPRIIRTIKTNKHIEKNI
jgi:preprotein translocase subunit YajC